MGTGTSADHQIRRRRFDARRARRQRLPPGHPVAAAGNPHQAGAAQGLQALAQTTQLVHVAGLVVAEQPHHRPLGPAGEPVRQARIGEQGGRRRAGVEQSRARPAIGGGRIRFPARFSGEGFMVSELAPDHFRNSVRHRCYSATTITGRCRTRAGRSGNDRRGRRCSPAPGRCRTTRRHRRRRRAETPLCRPRRPSVLAPKHGCHRPGEGGHVQGGGGGVVAAPVILAVIDVAAGEGAVVPDLGHRLVEIFPGQGCSRRRSYRDQAATRGQRATKLLLNATTVDRTRTTLVSGQLSTGV